MSFRQLGDERVERVAAAGVETDARAFTRITTGERRADAARRAGDEDVRDGPSVAPRTQPFGRSARALTISASMTGIIAACDPTFSVDTTNLPSMTMSGTDWTL